MPIQQTNKRARRAQPVCQDILDTDLYIMKAHSATNNARVGVAVPRPQQSNRTCPRYAEAFEFHILQHPPLKKLLLEEVVDAAYLGGASSRTGSSHSTDLDLFLTTKPQVPLSKISELITNHFTQPDYLVTGPSYLEGFGSFFKILHTNNPIDIFTNPSNTLRYNKMMHSNKIIFDDSGATTELFQSKDETKYLDNRSQTSRTNLVYYTNLLHTKLKKGKTVAAVRSHIYLLHALVDQSVLNHEPSKLPYIGLNEDEIIEHLRDRFGIDYRDLSDSAMRRVHRISTEFIKSECPEVVKFLNAEV